MARKAILGLMIVAVLTGAYTTSFAVTPEPAELVRLEITGLDEAAESSQAQYKAIAVYDNGGTEDVTDSALWSVEPNNNCGIAAGLLTTEMVDLPTDITITAQYSEGENIQEAQKDVSILPICSTGSALGFDGVDDYVEVADKPIFDIGDKLTVAHWFKTTTNQVQRGMVTHDSSNYKYMTYLTSNSGMIQFYIRQSSGPWSASTDDLGSGYWADGQWHLVVGVFDRSLPNNRSKLYVDGQLAGVRDVPDENILPGDEGIIIGKWYTGREFNGSIDDVRIYDRALTAEEIQALMHTRPDTDDLSLVAYWDFDEGEGPLTSDSAGGNNGQLGSTGGIDDGSPNWVDSVPPVGICTNRQLMERNFSDVFEIKLSILEQLEKALSKEQAIEYLLGECIASGELGDIKKNDLVKAEHDLSTAVRKENRAKTSVDESIDDLDDALATLNIELPVED